MARRPRPLALVALTVAGAAGGCGDDSITATTGLTEPTGLRAVIVAPDAGNYRPSINPADFEFVAGRCRLNTVRAVAFDLQAFVTVVDRDPLAVTASRGPR